MPQRAGRAMKPSPVPHYLTKAGSMTLPQSLVLLPVVPGTDSWDLSETTVLSFRTRCSEAFSFSLSGKARKLTKAARPRLLDASLKTSLRFERPPSLNHPENETSSGIDNIPKRSTISLAMLTHLLMTTRLPRLRSRLVKVQSQFRSRLSSRI